MGWVQAGQLRTTWAQVADKPETATRWPSITEVSGVNPKPTRAGSGFLRDDGLWANGYFNSLILYADNPGGGGRYIRVGQLNNSAARVPDGNMYIDLFSANSVAPADPQLRLIRWAGANGIGELVHRGNGQMRLWALGDAQLHFGSGGISRMYYDPATQGWSIPASGGLRIGGHAAHHDGNDARLITSDTDPGAVGAGAVWVRTSHPMGLHVRNSANSGWVRIGGGGMQVQKQQIFTADGTFTPPPGMIAQGGHCEVLLVSGGNSASGNFKRGQSAPHPGARDLVEWRCYGGSGGGVLKVVLSGVTTPQAVVVGAGGTTAMTPSHSDNPNTVYTLPEGYGGETRFGERARVNGAYANVDGKPFDVLRHYGGQAVFDRGVLVQPHPGTDGYGAGGHATRPHDAPISQGGNTGAGGSFASSGVNGKSGICIVTWWEAVS